MTADFGEELARRRREVAVQQAFAAWNRAHDRIQELQDQAPSLYSPRKLRDEWGAKLIRARHAAELAWDHYCAVRGKSDAR
jgi:hypothetical protein